MLAPRKDIRERLLANRLIDPMTGCWLWTKARDKNGYGLVSIKGKMRRVTRMSLLGFKGVHLGPKEQALHRCDNPPCFNPEHLFQGDARINRNDAFSKKRITGEILKSWFVKRSERVKAKTRCRSGFHVWTEVRVRVKADGSRECLACAAIAAKKRKELCQAGAS